MEREKQVTPAEAHAMQTAGEAVEIIDVREPAEYRAARVEPSRLIPLAELLQKADTLDRSRTLLMLCRSGRRSALAAQQLAARGFQTRNIEGGMLAWSAAGLPTIEG